MNQSLRSILSLATIATLTGCNGGGGANNPPIQSSSSSTISSSSSSASSTSSSSSSSVPDASITGSAFQFTSGTITIYNFQAGKKVISSMIPGGSLTTSGVIKNPISVFSGQPIIVELTNGCYIDEGTTNTGAVSGPYNCMGSDQVMRAMVVPTSGANNINLNVFTEAATGYAQYLATHGQTDVNAILTANTGMSNWLGFDIHNVTPIVTDSTATADSAHVYGLLLGGVVGYVYDAAVSVDHAIYGTDPYNSVSFASMMSADLAFDGVLDGFGDDGTGKRKALMLGSQALNASTYRHQVSAYAAIENRVLIPFNVYNTFVPSLVAVNNSSDNIFGNAAVVSLDEGAPTFLNNTFSGFSTASGSFHLSTYFTDIVGVSLMEVLVDGTHYTTMNYNWRFYNQATADVNTTIFKNGSHVITIKITNLLGDISTQSGTLLFSNDCTQYPLAC